MPQSFSWLSVTRACLYAAVFAVVIVGASTFFPFIGVKYYFFRTCISLAGIAFLIYAAFEAKDGEIKKRFSKIAENPLFLAVSIFVLAMLLATVFADDTWSAFWSNYERGDGMFQMFHYYGFFLLLLLTFTEKKYWDWLLKASLVAATAMIFYGVFAAARFSSYIGPYCNGPTIEQCISPTLWGRLSSSARFQGSLGNPAFVAPYLLFSIYYALHLWYTGKKKRWEWRDAFYGSLIAFFLLFFTLSQTRGAFLGLVAGIGAGVLYLIVRHREYRKMAGIFAAILLLLGGGAYLNRKALIDAKVPGSRFLELDLKEVTAQTRFWTWGSAWKGFLDRPIFGWGPENFTRVFDKYFDTRHYDPNQSTETWFDRAHSVIFDYLAETGIVGLAAYLGLITLLVITALSLPYAPLLIAFAVGLPVAYFVQGLVLFDVLATYLNLFLVAAFFVNEKTYD